MVVAERGEGGHGGGTEEEEEVSEGSVVLSRPARIISGRLHSRGGRFGARIALQYVETSTRSQLFK